MSVALAVMSSAGGSATGLMAPPICSRPVPATRPSSSIVAISRRVLSKRPMRPLSSLSRAR